MLYTILSSPVYCLGVLTHILVKGSPGLLWAAAYLIVADVRAYPDCWARQSIQDGLATTDRGRRAGRVFAGMLVSLILTISVMLMYAVGDVPNPMYSITDRMVGALCDTLNQGWSRI